MARTPAPLIAIALALNAIRERPIHVEVVDDGGFSWTDAGIGALAAIGLVLVIAGAVIAARTQQRAHRAPKGRN